MLRASELLRAEVRDAGRVRLRVPGHRRPFEHRLEVAPVVGADLLAVGRELAEWIAAPLQKTQHAPLIIERKLGKIAPPTLDKVDRVGPPSAGGLDDERVDEGHLASRWWSGSLVDDLFAGDDLCGRPASPGK